jgi:hypothetical protein
LGNVFFRRGHLVRIVNARKVRFPRHVIRTVVRASVPYDFSTHTAADLAVVDPGHTVQPSSRPLSTFEQSGLGSFGASGFRPLLR